MQAKKESKKTTIFPHHKQCPLVFESIFLPTLALLPDLCVGPSHGVFTGFDRKARRKKIIASNKYYYLQLHNDVKCVK